MNYIKTTLLLAIYLMPIFFMSCSKDEDDPTDDTSPAITAISPISGAVGSSVIITGKNFNPVAASNSVLFFNGKSATVTAASPTELSVVVPADATTGSINLQINSKTAVSPQVFTVTQVADAPVITSLSPSSGPIGTSVTITGSKFSSTANQNEVKFNGTVATVSSATAIQLVVTVPSGATTGTLTIKVNGLTATSASAFTVTGTSPSQWTAKTNFGGNARAWAASFAIGTKGYIGMGMNFMTPYEDFWEYDATGGAWTQKANFGGGKRYKAASFVIGTKAYVATGIDAVGNEMKDLWEYDPSLNKWTQKANYGGTMMYGGFAFTLGGKGYVGSSQMWAYDPSNNSWTQKKSYEGSGRAHSAAFTIGDKAYVGTGYAVSTGESHDFWEYDATLDDWTQKADVLGADRGEGVGFAINGKGYLGLGSNDLVDLYEFNPINNTWTKKNDFIKAGGLYAAAVFVINNKAYIGTGNDLNINASKSFFEFDPTK